MISHKGNLLFTPGVLLNGIAGLEGKPIDYDEVTTNGKIDQKKYDSLIEKRLLPLLAHANETASKEGKPAVITMPGIGCGNFAGEFYGKMGAHLDLAMQNMLKKHEKKFPNIACIYDPYNEVENTEKNIGGIKYRVRSSEQTPDGQGKKPQLLPPEQYEEKKGEFKNCTLYKIVAWAHVSLPGNDFYEGNNRNTDDGVVAAATNVLQKITGIEGKYNKDDMMYLPPASYRDWEQVARKNNIHLIANNNVKITLTNGKTLSLNEYELTHPAKKIYPKVSQETKLEQPKSKGFKRGGFENLMGMGFEAQIKTQQAKKMQQEPIKPIINIIYNANLQNPNHAEELAKVQTKLENCFKENKLAAPNKVDQYLKSEASQDRQEVMKDSKLPFKDKIYSLIVKMSDALGISSLKNYCQKKLDEHAVQRQEKKEMTNKKPVNSKGHVERLKESTIKRGDKGNARF